MNQAIITTANAQRWQAALARALSNALDVLIATDGSAYVESASKPGLIYSVSREFCSCPAGLQGKICMHRACYLCQVGELPLDPEPNRITITGSSDRVDIQVDNRHHGFAQYSNDLGWVFFRGAFPHARRMGIFATLDELRADLAARMPLTFHIPVVVPDADLVAA